MSLEIPIIFGAMLTVIATLLYGFEVHNILPGRKSRLILDLTIKTILVLGMVVVIVSCVLLWTN